MKKRRRVTPRLKLLVKVGAAMVAIVLVAGLAYAGLNRYYSNRALHPNLAVAAPQASAVPAKRVSTPVHVKIDGYVDIGLEQQTYGNGQWTVSDTQGSYLNQSAKPGQNGNIIIYGHNKQEIFGKITKLTGSETIVLTTEDGAEHRYAITSLQEVGQNQTDLLQPTDTEVLTMYTCSGFLDSKRFVVRAKPIT